MRKVYLDNAATTYVSGEVINEMLPCFNAIYGNPSSIHSFGREAMAIVDRARDRIAHAICAEKSNEIYFTSGGSESNSWAIRGIAHAYRGKGKHIITTKIEHESILDTCASLEKEGYRVTYLPVDEFGLVSVADLMHEITPETTLISIMAVNNEVGTIQNIKALGMTAKEKGIIFHVDGVQALGAIHIDVQDMQIDALSIAGHKIYGPKGIGALYLRNGIRIEPLIYGTQERGKRGGTLNVPEIAGFGKAAEIATRDLYINTQKLKGIRHYFLAQVEDKITGFKVNGHPQQKVQGILSISFEQIEGESVLMLLDLQGIAVSTGSACASGSLEPSHVLQAMGVSDEISHGTIRFSFPKSISKEDVDYTIEKLTETIQKLRAISPVSKAGRKKKNV